MSNEEFSDVKSSEVFWRNLILQFWYVVVLFGIIIIGAIIGTILIFDWYIRINPIGGQGTWTFDQFSMGTLIELIIFLILWELIIVIIPGLIGVGIIIGILWFVIFTPELKDDIKLQIKRDEERERRYGRRSEGGGAFGFLMFIGVCIYIFIDGNWATEFGNLNIRYFVDAWITVFIWVLIIFGIPILIIATIWFLNKYGTEAS